MFDINILTKLSKYHNELFSCIDINTFNNDKEIYDFIQNYVSNNNLKLAFPIGISINNVIAHNSYHESNIVYLKENDVIKIDVGFIESGNIIDSARTFVYNITDYELQKTIDNSKYIISQLEKYIENTLKTSNSVLIQNISTLTSALMISKGYKALDYIGGHSIEFNKVHGKKLILNKPLKLLPKQAEEFIDKNEVLENEEMFALEIYLNHSKQDGQMVKSTTIPTSHYEINNKPLNSLNNKELETYNNIKQKTNNLVYHYSIHNKYNKEIIEKLIKLEYIISHEALEYISKNESKFIQYEDCYLIRDNKLINVMKL